MDLRSYVSAKRGDAAGPKADTPDAAGTAAQQQQIKDTMARYSGKSQDELLEELTRVAAEQKASGALSNDQLQQMAERMAPALDAAQQQKLRQLVAMLTKE